MTRTTSLPSVVEYTTDPNTLVRIFDQLRCSYNEASNRMRLEIDVLRGFACRRKDRTNEV